MSGTKFWRWVHLVLTIVWFLVIGPTLLWWSESILWVALMSTWANAAGHFSAWQAARAEGSVLWCRVHLVLTAVWFIAIVPTLLWWSESILWVALMSAWANAAGHFSAWQAVRVEETIGS